MQKIFSRWFDENTWVGKERRQRRQECGTEMIIDQSMEISSHIPLYRAGSIKSFPAAPVYHGTKT